MNRTKIGVVVSLLFATNVFSQSQTAIDPLNNALTPRETHQLCYSNLYGVGTEQDFAKALPWCKLAASAGIPSAQTLLAEIYFLGLGVPKDYKSSAHWYEEAASQGHPHAKFMLYRLYVVYEYGTEVDKVHGLQALEEAAAMGYPKAIQALDERKATESNGEREARDPASSPPSH